jgi:hypothetical protein
VVCRAAATGIRTVLILVYPLRVRWMLDCGRVLDGHVAGELLEEVVLEDLGDKAYALDVVDVLAVGADVSSMRRVPGGAINGS